LKARRWGVGSLQQLTTNGKYVEKYFKIIHAEIANKMKECIKIYYSMFI